MGSPLPFEVRYPSHEDVHSLLAVCPRARHALYTFRRSRFWSVGQSEKLQNFFGCTAEQRNAIIDAYDDGIDIAYYHNQGVTFDDPSTEEFLGTHEKNAQHQATIKSKSAGKRMWRSIRSSNNQAELIRNAWTFHRAYPWAPYPTWKISIRCDDFHRTCAKYKAAAAYTVNPGTRYDNKPTVDVDIFNVCWDRFKTKTICNQDIQDRSKSNSLTDYQCRGKCKDIV
jgi:hypothetical protein